MLLKRDNRKTLRQLMEKGQVFTPIVWDCFTAYMAEIEGFEAILLSGGCLQGNICGFPDIGLSSVDDLIRMTQSICNYSDLPLVVDADDGYGESPLVTYRTACRLVDAGAAAFTIEDTTGFRGINRWGNGSKPVQKSPVVDRDLWLSKVKASVAACKGSDCLVVARTDSLIGYGREEAVERCNRAHELGADMTMIIGQHTLEEAAYFAEHVEGELFYPDITSKDGKPYMTLDQLKELGYGIVSCHFFEKACIAGIHDFCKHFKADLTTVYGDTYPIDFEPGTKPFVFQTNMYNDPWLLMEQEFMNVDKK